MQTMRRVLPSGALYLLVLSSIAGLGAWLGCRQEGGLALSVQKAGSSDDIVLTETTVEYNPAYDAWIAREDTLDCSERPCPPLAAYRFHANCTKLVLQKPRTGWCTSSTLRLDFDTSSLSDCAIVTDVHLNLYWASGSRSSSYELLDIGNCSQADLEDGENSLVPTSFYEETTTAGEVACSEWVQQETGGASSPPVTLSAAVGNKVSLTKVSRYGLDFEYDGEYARRYIFNSVEATANKPTLVVKYLTTNPSYGTCLDGQVEHKQTNCSGCGASDFTTTTTAVKANAKRDSTQSGFCGEKQMVLYFDTSGLPDAAVVPCGKLTFVVSSTSEVDITTHRLRVWTRKVSGSCPTDLGSGDFIGCGSGYTDLGLITISGTGTKTFTIVNPSAVFNTVGQTQFVLVNQSVFTSDAGSSNIEIHTNEAASSSNRPKLETS